VFKPDALALAPLPHDDIKGSKKMLTRNNEINKPLLFGVAIYLYFID
jgi:hypothetical protein